jgi:hypothetical protein
MEEGKIATAWAQVWCDWKKSINVYKNACATLSNTLLARAGWDQFQPLVNQPVVFN